MWTVMQQPGYDIIAQFIFGYILPGKPIANLIFKIYGRISTIHALSFLSDLKLGHYMKIPPRSMYMAQVSSLYQILSFTVFNIRVRLVLYTKSSTCFNHFLISYVFIYLNKIPLTPNFLKPMFE